MGKTLVTESKLGTKMTESLWILKGDRIPTFGIESLGFQLLWLESPFFAHIYQGLSLTENHWIPSHRIPCDLIPMSITLVTESKFGTKMTESVWILNGDRIPTFGIESIGFQLLGLQSPCFLLTFIMGCLWQRIIEILATKYLATKFQWVNPIDWIQTWYKNERIPSDIKRLPNPNIWDWVFGILNGWDSVGRVSVTMRFYSHLERIVSNREPCCDRRK